MIGVHDTILEGGGGCVKQKGMNMFVGFAPYSFSPWSGAI